MKYYVLDSTGDYCEANSKRSALCQFSAKLGREVKLCEISESTAKKILKMIERKG